MAEEGQIEVNKSSSEPVLPTPTEKATLRNFGQRQAFQDEGRGAAKRLRKEEANYDGACRGEFTEAEVDQIIEDASRSAEEFFNVQGSQGNEECLNSQTVSPQGQSSFGRPLLGVVSLADLGGIMCDIMALSHGDVQLCRPQPIAGTIGFIPFAGS